MLDPHYSGPLDEFCPYQCEETRSPGQYSCSGDCEVEPAGATCTGAPFICRPPFDTSAGYNYARCLDAVDAASCASMRNDDSSGMELLGCVGISTVRTQIPVLSSAVYDCFLLLPPATLTSHGPIVSCSLSQPDETCTSVFHDRGSGNRACPLHEEEMCAYLGPQFSCTNGEGQETCNAHAWTAAECVDDQARPCIFQDFSALVSQCSDGFNAQLASGVYGDHASICSSTHRKHVAFIARVCVQNCMLPYLRQCSPLLCAAACHYTPPLFCQAHHHEVACQPRPAVFTGVAGSDSAPSTDGAVSYLATGASMLFAASVRGDELNRLTARLACAASYQAGSPEDQRCGPACVRTIVTTGDTPEETCVPVSRYCRGTRSLLPQSATLMFVYGWGIGFTDMPSLTWRRRLMSVASTRLLNASTRLTEDGSPGGIQVLHWFLSHNVQNVMLKSC